MKCPYMDVVPSVVPPWQMKRSCSKVENLERTLPPYRECSHPPALATVAFGLLAYANVQHIAGVFCCPYAFAAWKVEESSFGKECIQILGSPCHRQSNNSAWLRWFLHEPQLLSMIPPGCMFIQGCMALYISAFAGWREYY